MYTYYIKKEALWKQNIKKDVQPFIVPLSLKKQMHLLYVMLIKPTYLSEHLLTLRGLSLETPQGSVLASLAFV